MDPLLHAYFYIKTVKTMSPVFPAMLYIMKCSVSFNKFNFIRYCK